MHLAEQHLFSHVFSKSDLIKQKQSLGTTPLHKVKLCNIYRCEKFLWASDRSGLLLRRRDVRLRRQKHVNSG